MTDVIKPLNDTSTASELATAVDSRSCECSWCGDQCDGHTFAVANAEDVSFCNDQHRQVWIQENVEVSGITNI